MTSSHTPSALHLADPAHPARNYIDQAAKFIDDCITLETFGDSVVSRASVDFAKAGEALARFDEGITGCPGDLDLQLAKAAILQAVGQFKSAEDVLDEVLKVAPNHFDARMWKDHWNTWENATRFPGWDERQTSLHPMTLGFFQRTTALTVVRDGLQKALLVTAAGPSYVMDSRTEAKVKWVLSKTPYGPLIAYYVSIREPGEEPHDVELFVAPLEPVRYSAMEGIFLMQQLAYAPYCFVVLANGPQVVLNRRVVFSEKTAGEVREIAATLAAGNNYLPKDQFQNAGRWHMNNFDMDGIVYD